jgi:hypothetical protein
VIGYSINDLWPNQDIALNGIAVTLPTSGPQSVFFTGMGNRPALHVYEPELPQLPTRIIREKSRQCLTRCHPSFH